MFKKNIKSCLLVLFFISSLHSQNYIWPTNSSKNLSATFGEFRSGHFHSGIDIKTNNKTGFPVYAIEKGYITKARVSPFGYGKAVYLQLDNGHTAVYAHLENFTAIIQKPIQNLQQEKNRFAVEKYFQKNQIPVSKGDIIAYTGVSGTKHPHLHFEIRDKSDHPINPFLCGLSINDFTIPSIKEIAIIPIDKHSRIDGLPKIKTFPVSYKGQKQYYIRQKNIKINGPIAIEIKTYDTVHGLWNKYGPYSIKLFHNNELQFAQQYDTLSFEKSHLIEIDRDQQLMINDKGRFIRMWNYSNNETLPFYTTDKTGILNLQEGENHIRIEVQDYNKNKSTLNINLYQAIETELKVMNILQDTSKYDIYLKRDSLHLYHDISARWIDKYGNQIKKIELSDFSKTDSTYKMSIPKPLLHPSIEIYANAVKNRTCHDIQIALTTDKSYQNNDFTVSYIHNPSTFLCELSFSKIPGNTPTFFLQDENNTHQVKLIRKSALTYITEPVDFDLWANSLYSEVRFGQNHKEIARIPFNFHLITPKTSIQLISEDSSAIVNFGREAVYNPMLIGITKVLPDSQHYMPHGTSFYYISPKEQTLKNKIGLQISYAPGTQKPEQLGIYSYEKGEFSILDQNKIYPEKYYIKAQSGSTGTFGILRDNVPPEITKVYPGNGGSYHNVKILQAHVDDHLSGIEDDTSIEMMLNGKKLICEYNAGNGMIKYLFPQYLAPGQYNLTIVVTDKAMNQYIKNSLFNILEKF